MASSDLIPIGETDDGTAVFSDPAKIAAAQGKSSGGSGGLLNSGNFVEAAAGAFELISGVLRNRRLGRIRRDVRKQLKVVDADRKDLQTLLDGGTITVDGKPVSLGSMADPGLVAALKLQLSVDEGASNAIYDQVKAIDSEESDNTDQEIVGGLTLADALSKGGKVVSLDGGGQGILLPLVAGGALGLALGSSQQRKGKR